MHPSASELGRLFFQFYWKDGFRRILDIGSLVVNGSLRQYRPPAAEYVGIDLSEGPGVDLVLEDPYQYLFPPGHFDLIVSTSCFEHDPMFWLTFLEASRVLSPSGFLYINAPSNGWYHTHPWDNWRFYPDAALALESWGRRSGCPMNVIESFFAGRSNGDVWNDCVMIFSKAHVVPERFISDVTPVAYNIRKLGHIDLGNPSPYPEDMKIINDQNAKIRELTTQLATSAAPVAPPRLSIYCVVYKRYDKIPVLVHSFMCQTYRDFQLVVIHDGEDNLMRAILSGFKATYPDHLDFIFTDRRFNDYGHSLRAMAIERCNSEFIMQTNDDNYYVPTFLELMFKKIDGEQLDLVLCDMVHSHDRPGGRPQESYHAFVTEPRKFSLGIGCLIVKTELAKAVGFRDKSRDGDGTFVEDIMHDSGQKVKWGKVDKILFVHN